MRQGTVSVSILSGKGGVGKSNIALNLGCALNMAGNSVLLADCDMGLANMDVLLGLTPQFHMQDMLLEDLTAENVIVPVLRDRVGTAAPFMLLPANSGLAELVDLDAGARSILRDKINPLALSYDFLFLDIGAGIAPTAMEFGAMTTFRVVVVTPEPTSLTDSYAMMKVLSGRHGIQDFLILVNQVENAEEGALTYRRLAAVCDKFLGFTPLRLGEIRMDRAVAEAVRKQRPLLQVSPHAPAATDFRTVGSTLQRLRTERLSRGKVEIPLRDLYLDAQA